MKRQAVICPPDAHYFDSENELLEYMSARAAGDEDPDLLMRIRHPGFARGQDALAGWRRLPGSGWSNLRRC